MNRRGDQEQLLNDVLAEAMPTGLREEVLDATLRQVRRRRHLRQARQTLGALALLLGIGFLLWPHSQGPSAMPDAQTPYVLVRTQPLPSAEIVKTVPLGQSSRIASNPTASIISTATAPRLAREIDDADLLSLAAPNPVVLVRLGPHSAELVFAHTTDAQTEEHQTGPQ